MGAGASAAEGRVFCHHCGARTASSSADGGLRCGSCGATDGVEATDQRLPTTGPTLVAGTGGSSSSSTAPALAAEGGTDLLSTRLGAAVANTGLQERSSMRVESVTVVATQRPEDGGLFLRVLPNVVSRQEALSNLGDGDDWEATPEPACDAFISRLEKAPLSLEAADSGSLCVICSEDLAEEGASIVQLSCGHQFHDSCIRRWLMHRHTCPTCRFEMEVDNVKYLRSIGLGEEADSLEQVEQEKQARELQKQAAARRRWVLSMRRGDPVHFGLVCAHCSETPLIGQCYKCTTCEGYILCSECHKAHEADSAQEKHPKDHAFEEFGVGTGAALPNGPGGQLTVLLPAPARSPHSDNSSMGTSELEASGESPGEAALAAAEAAFVAVRSLAFAPLVGSVPPATITAAALPASSNATGSARAALAAAAAASVGGSAAATRGFVRRAG